MKTRSPTITKYPQCAQIAGRLTNPFQKAVFAAAIQSLEQKDNPLRFNNFATNLRELGRIMLDDLSLDSSVVNCGWYIPVLNERKKEIITRAQRVKYAVQAGLPDDFVLNTLRVDVGWATQKYTKLIERLSAFTHINATTFGITQSAERKLAKEAFTTFVLVLKTIDNCRSRVESKVELRAREALTDELFEHTVDALDEIATHHTVHGAEIEELNLKSMNSETIVFAATGFVDCELQYGSDGDYSRGDGVCVEDSYPLKCKLVADISTPLDLEVRDLRVDNSSFYE